LVDGPDSSIGFDSDYMVYEISCVVAFGEFPLKVSEGRLHRDFKRDPSVLVNIRVSMVDPDSETIIYIVSVEGKRGVESSS
jgi:hypothetical protein